MNITECPTCGKASNPKSKKGYCTEDMRKAREAWKKMIADKPTAAERDAKHQELYVKAQEAGLEAAAAATPTPMVVTDGKTNWYVEGGVCGFAWVRIVPGNSSFALWLKRTGIASKAYEGGVQVWAGNVGGQSLAIKEAWARAFAATLTEAGIQAYSASRMD